jgi:large repetitive protein
LLPDVSAPPGLSLNQNGVITGVPTETGTYSFTLGVTATTEDGELTAYQRGSITIRPAVISILTGCPLEGGSVGRPYSLTLRASGSSSGYSWSVDDRSSLPPGIGLSSDGLLAGTPFTPGTYILNLRARANGSSDSQPARQLCHLTINPAAVRLASGCTLPNATVNVPYSQLLSADGGIAPYRYQLFGQLPSGLALTSDGLVSGTPLAAVSYAFQVSVTDSRGTRTAQDCSLAVNSPAFDVSSACPLPAGVTGAAYNTKLPGAYTWSLAGTLPAGLVLSPDGSISGTPMTAGPFRFALIATDGDGNQVGQACSLPVTRGPLSISGCPLPDASAGQPYQNSLTALGGSAPYFFTAAGSLPVGINLLSTGVLSGNSTAAGSYAFSVTVRESSGQTFTQPCRLDVSPTLLHITSCPLPQAQLGQSYSTRVTAEGGSAPYRFDFFGFLPDGLQAASDGSVTGTPQALGGQSFLVRLTDARNQSIDSVCSVSVALPPAPQVRIAGMPATAPPAATNLAVTVELGQTYTQPIEGQVVLSIQPDTRSSSAAANQADPRLRFGNGQTTASFTLAAGSKQVKLPLVSTGTVASTVTVSLNKLRAAGVDLPLFPAPQTFSITPTAPVVTSACYARSSTGINLQVNGYSTTRELTRAELTIGTEKVKIDLDGLAADFFSAPESIRSGGTFALTAPRDMILGATVPDIAMNVFNSIGASGSRTLQACP